MSGKEKSRIKGIDILKNLDFYFSVVAIVYAAIVGIATVISRKCFGTTSAALEEFNMIVYVWFFYATIVCAVRKRKHVRVEVLDLYLSPKNSMRMKLVADSIWFVFSIYLTYAAFRLVLFNIQHAAETTMLSIPMFIVYAIVLISFAVMSVSIFFQILERFKGLKNNKMTNPAQLDLKELEESL